MELDRNTTALLVIDAIEAVGDDSLYDPDAATAAYRAAVARSVATCHAAGIPVIYCNDAHVRGLDRELELWGEHGVAGEVRVFPEIEQAPGDITVPKRRYSGFFQTDLDLTLRELGVRTVIAVGATPTSASCTPWPTPTSTTTPPSWLTDATTDLPPAAPTRVALEHCEKCYGSELVTVAELEAALA